MPFSKKTFLFFAPHQDDELLTMGIAIASAVARRHNVHVILCTDGSKSGVRNTLCNGKGCPKHEGIHSYTLSIPEFVAARDREFVESCRALGVEESHIHIPENREKDGFLSPEAAEDLILSYRSLYGNDATICTTSPTNGPAQHRDHKALGKAARQLLERGVLKEVWFFIEPYQYPQMQANPGDIPADLSIQKASPREAEALKKAIAAYSYWNPAEGRYGIGSHSVSNEFQDFLMTMTSYSFLKRNPPTGWIQRLFSRHRT